MIDDSSITHVADTAFWVAYFREKESQRAAPAFNDPFAALLCGSRGRQIARSIPRAAMTEWGMVVRTTAIDRLIYEALQSGVDTVLNLGAGLDTRPYRMNLPADLQWIEMDFPDIVELKDSKLVEHQPVCRLERVGIDLLDRSSRNTILARYGATSKRTLVITEGVLTFFSIPDAAALASDLHATTPICSWIQDFDNAGQRRLPSGWEEKLKAAPILFKVKDWFEFFEKYGWRPSRVITNFDESLRVNRPYPLDFPYGLILRALPKAMSQKILSLSGAVLMQSVHPIVGCDQIPARLAPPSGLGHSAAESGDTPRDLRIRHKFRLLRLHIGREAGGKLGSVERQEPLLGRKDRRNRCARRRILDQAGDRFAAIRGKCGDIDKAGDTEVVTGFGDDGSTVRMPYEHHGALLRGDDALGCGHIVGQRSCRILHDTDAVAVLLQDPVNALPTRAIDESAVN